MIYSDLYLKQNSKLPAAIGIIMVLFIGVFFSKLFLGLTGQSKASLKVAKRVEIVNLSPLEAGIFWQTDTAETGWVIYGEREGSENKTASDVKDLSNQEQNKGRYKIHLATLKEMSPGKKYFFKMISNNNQVIAQPDGSSFSFITPQSGLNSLQNISPAYGKVLQSNLEPLVNSYVLLSVKGGYPLLTEIKSEGDGSWLISLNKIYSKDGQNLLTISDKEIVNIEVITGEGEGATITANLSKVSPLPQTIVFEKNKNFSFVDENNVLSALTNSTDPSDSTDSTNLKVDIIYPKEGSLVPGSIPLIKGVGAPKTVIEITVNSKKTYSAVVTSDAGGNWSYLLPEDLELGPHTVVIKTKDGTGKLLMITRKFTIIAQQGNEGRVLGTATGEPTIILTVTPVPTYSVPTTIPAEPSEVVTTPPVSGSNFIGTIIGSLSLIIIGGGILLAF